MEGVEDTLSASYSEEYATRWTNGHYSVCRNKAFGVPRFSDEFCRFLAELEPSLENRILESKGTLSFLPRHHLRWWRRSRSLG